MVKINIVKKSFIFFKIFLTTLLTFFILDLIIGNYVYKKILRKNFIDVDTNMGRIHPVYNRALKKNYNTLSAGWGPRRYTFCTDNFGFRNFCGKKYSNKEFDLGIIGDSQTAGTGFNFEDTFSTLIANDLKTKKIANLAVSMYGGSIYYSKINYLLKNNFSFKEIIVFFDVSDFNDDTVLYNLKNDVVSINYLNLEENYSFNEKLMIFLNKRFKTTAYLVSFSNELLISNNLKERRIPHWVENNPRSNWTSNYDKSWYLNKELDQVTNHSLEIMDNLYELLKEKNIKLSIGVFPWPGNLKYDSENNLHVQIWEDFCLTRCKKFYNLMKPFYELKKEIGYKKLYFKSYIHGDVHFNEFGHKLIAENFLKEYKK